LATELAAESQRRAELETALRTSEQQFRRLVENAPDTIYRIALKPSVHVEYISPNVEEMTGYPPEQFYADPTLGMTLVHPEDRHLIEARNNMLVPEEGPPLVYRVITRSGKKIWVEQRFTVVKDSLDRPLAIEGIIRDRTEQVLARAALQQSLQEKELLLKEIHHRVKNNLTLVSSLLELQAATSEDDRLREMLAISRKRLLSVARIHEALSQSENLGQIDLRDYIIRLGNEFAEALGSECTSICYDLEEATVAVRHAVQFGLIFNELISNAFKHAFPVGLQVKPAIVIQLKSTSAGILTTVKDNGIGLPIGFNLHDSKSLGLQIVQMLAEQLGGRVEFTSAPGAGTSFTVLVPLAENEDVTILS
jgi:PAS domain S-box-containing protein